MVVVGEHDEHPLAPHEPARLTMAQSLLGSGKAMQRPRTRSTRWSELVPVPPWPKPVPLPCEVPTTTSHPSAGGRSGWTCRVERLLERARSTRSGRNFGPEGPANRRRADHPVPSYSTTDCPAPPHGPAPPAGPAPGHRPPGRRRKLLTVRPQLAPSATVPLRCRPAPAGVFADDSVDTQEVAGADDHRVGARLDLDHVTRFAVQPGRSRPSPRRCPMVNPYAPEWDPITRPSASMTRLAARQGTTEESRGCRRRG
jgi:hypothetical protein